MTDPHDARERSSGGPPRVPRARVRLTLTERQVRLLARSLRESAAAGLLRTSELEDAYELLTIVDQKLPTAEERHPAGGEAAELLLGESILRVLAAAEDDGRRELTPLEVNPPDSWRAA